MATDKIFSPGRRVFVKRGALMLAVAGVAGIPVLAAEEDVEEVAPPEDLMREHGVLKRVLLIYREAIRRLENGMELPPAVLARSAAIIRDFIEDYHEKLEEDHLFPRFRQAGVEVDLVNVLVQQHAGGRRLTDQTLALCKRDMAFHEAGSRRAVIDSLQQFIRMYEPHEAREDTVLFPALRKIVSKHEFAALGEQFEKKEHDLFGQDGFEKFVEEVATLEKTLGIYDLGQFTPKT
ncbi:MAG: hypothetical protein JWM32_1475 [Verrucomicrobia bacterium]|nr:hypothetical protein [Verrucomicrobiota bacterium]